VADAQTATALVEIPAAIAARLASNHRTNRGLEHAGGRTRAQAAPFERFVDLVVGQRVQFHAPARRWWTVEAVRADGDVVVLTRQNRDFGRDEQQYTIIVWSEGRRGPHNSWGYGAETREECERIARDFDGDVTLALSERRAVYLDIAKIEARACTSPGREHAEPEEQAQERARLLEVVVLIYERWLASASLVVHKLGFTHREVWAMFDRLAELGILGPAHGTRARDFLVEQEEAVRIVLAT